MMENPEFEKEKFPMPVPEKEPSPREKIIEYSQKIREALLENKEIPKKMVGETLRELDQELIKRGNERTENVNVYYQEIDKRPRSELLLREMPLEEGLPVLFEERGLLIEFHRSREYSNAVSFDGGAGLKVALAEGRGSDFGLFVFGFETRKMEYVKKDLEKSHCWRVKGTLKSQDLRYLFMRIPRYLFPEEQLTKQEKIHRLPFIFRGYKFPPQETKGKAEK